uniref:Uncharacterized protein n=1 Tax=Neospora caninum (strain Liverpool) TaxID=572307 RepID=A0A0F7U9J1_NEOCL|nr:TPA: hypothetical protein BN1204_015330 [Neospora caninum Liverpool]
MKPSASPSSSSSSSFSPSSSSSSYSSSSSSSFSSSSFASSSSSSSSSFASSSSSSSSSFASSSSSSSSSFASSSSSSSSSFASSSSSSSSFSSFSFSSSSSFASSASSSSSSSSCARRGSACLSSLARRREERRKAKLQLQHTVSGLTSLTAETLALKAVDSSLRFTCACSSNSLPHGSSLSPGDGPSTAVCSTPCSFSIFSCPHDSLSKKRRKDGEKRQGGGEAGRRNETAITRGRRLSTGEPSTRSANDWDGGDGRRGEKKASAGERRETDTKTQGDMTFPPRGGERGTKKPARALSGAALVDKAFGTVVLPLLKKLFSSVPGASSSPGASSYSSPTVSSRFEGRGELPGRKRFRRETEAEEPREEASDADDDYEEDDEMLLANAVTLRSLLRFVRDVLTGRIDRDAPRGLCMRALCRVAEAASLLLSCLTPLLPPAVCLSPTSGSAFAASAGAHRGERNGSANPFPRLLWLVKEDWAASLLACMQVLDNYLGNQRCGNSGEGEAAGAAGNWTVDMGTFVAEAIEGFAALAAHPPLPSRLIDQSWPSLFPRTLLSLSFADKRAFKHHASGFLPSSLSSSSFSSFSSTYRFAGSPLAGPLQPPPARQAAHPAALSLFQQLLVQLLSLGSLPAMRDAPCAFLRPSRLPSFAQCPCPSASVSPGSLSSWFLARSSSSSSGHSLSRSAFSLTDDVRRANCPRTTQIDDEVSPADQEDEANAERTLPSRHSSSPPFAVSSLLLSSVFPSASTDEAILFSLAGACGAFASKGGDAEDEACMHLCGLAIEGALGRLAEIASRMHAPGDSHVFDSSISLTAVPALRNLQRRKRARGDEADHRPEREEANARGEQAREADSETRLDDERQLLASWITLVLHFAGESSDAESGGRGDGDACSSSQPTVTARWASLRTDVRHVYSRRYARETEIEGNRGRNKHETCARQMQPNNRRKIQKKRENTHMLLVKGEGCGARLVCLRFPRLKTLLLALHRTLFLPALAVVSASRPASEGDRRQAVEKDHQETGSEEAVRPGGARSGSAAARSHPVVPAGSGEKSSTRDEKTGKLRGVPEAFWVVPSVFGPLLPLVARLLSIYFLVEDLPADEDAALRFLDVWTSARCAIPAHGAKPAWTVPPELPHVLRLLLTAVADPVLRAEVFLAVPLLLLGRGEDEVAGSGEEREREENEHDEQATGLTCRRGRAAGERRGSEIASLSLVGAVRCEGPNIVHCEALLRGAFQLVTNDQRLSFYRLLHRRLESLASPSIWQSPFSAQPFPATISPEFLSFQAALIALAARLLSPPALRMHGNEAEERARENPGCRSVRETGLAAACDAAEAEAEPEWDEKADSTLVLSLLASIPRLLSSAEGSRPKTRGDALERGIACSLSSLPPDVLARLLQAWQTARASAPRLSPHSASPMASGSPLAHAIWWFPQFAGFDTTVQGALGETSRPQGSANFSALLRRQLTHEIHRVGQSPAALTALMIVSKLPKLSLFGAHPYVARLSASNRCLACSRFCSKCGCRYGFRIHFLALLSPPFPRF